MLGLIPFVVVLLVIAAVYAHRARLEAHLGPVGQALSLCVGVTLSGLWLVASTELLSLFSALTWAPVLLSWCLLGGLAGVAIRRGDARGVLRWPEGGVGTQLLIACVGVLLAIVAVMAVLSPPNNYDSMAYHLARQLFWMQQGSVDFYPTNSIRQLFMPPLCEYAQLHAMILAGSDRWSNLVQTGALAATAVGVAHLARTLGAGTFGGALAALFIVSNPMAFLEGSSTKNDVMVSWLVVQTCIFAVRVVELRRYSWLLVACIGSTLGLLLLAKGTAVVFALPVCLVAGVAMIRYGMTADTATFGELARRPRHWLALLAAGGVIAFTAFLPNAGHFHRNYHMFGHLTGPVEPEVEGSSLYVNEHMASWATLSSNVLRNVTLHLSLPEPSSVFNGWRPWDAWNNGVLDLSLSLHERLGLDPNADNTTWKGMPYKVVYFPKSEDRAGTAVHFLQAVLLPFLALPRLLRRRASALHAVWLVVPVVGFLAFCMVFRWQPWHARLHIPLFALVAPSVGWLFDADRWRVPGWLVALASLVWLIPTFGNVGRPLYGKTSIWSAPRDSMRLNWRPKWRPGTQLVVDLVKKLKPSSLGYRFGHNDIQYPIGRMLRDALPNLRLVNVNPKPITNPRGEAPTPEALVVVGPYQLERTENGQRYRIAAFQSPYTLFIREDLYATAPKALDRHRFLGWTAMNGLRKPGEGKRVARTDEASLSFSLGAATRAALVVTGVSPKHAEIEVWSGAELLTRFAPTAVPKVIPLAGRRGLNTLQLRGVRGVTFTTLRLEPEGASAPAASAPDPAAPAPDPAAQAPDPAAPAPNPGAPAGDPAPTVPPRRAPGTRTAPVR